MADTQRSLADLQALLADNVTRDISPQDVRDFLLSVYTQPGPAILVAASSAPTMVKNRADYVCDGTADNVQIQAAIDGLGANGGLIQLSQGTFSIAATLDINANVVHITGAGWVTKLIAAAGLAVMIDVTGFGYGCLDRMVLSQPLTTSPYSHILLGPGCFHMRLDRLYLNADVKTAGQIGIKLTSDGSVGSYWHEFNNPLIYSMATGIDASSTGAQGQNNNKIFGGRIADATNCMLLGGATGLCDSWSLYGTTFGSFTTSGIHVGSACRRIMGYGLLFEGPDNIPTLLIDAGATDCAFEISHGGQGTVADKVTDNGTRTTIIEGPTSGGVAGSVHRMGARLDLYGGYWRGLRVGETIKNHYGSHHGANNFLYLGHNARAYDGSNVDLDDPSSYGTLIEMGGTTHRLRYAAPGTNPVSLINQLYLEYDGWTLFDSTKTKRMVFGTAVLVAGEKVVTPGKDVTASSIILLTSQVDGGTPGWVRVSARDTGNDTFTITSSSGADTSTIAWLMIEPG